MQATDLGIQGRTTENHSAWDWVVADAAVITKVVPDHVVLTERLSLRQVAWVKHCLQSGWHASYTALQIEQTNIKPV